MAITKLQKHDDHRVTLHLTKGRGPHHAALRCAKCRVHIQWLNKTDTAVLEAAGIEVLNHQKEKFYGTKTARL